MIKHFPIDVGDVIKTSYSERRYRVTQVYGPCRCATYLDEINTLPGESPPPTPPHYHITMVEVSMPDRKSNYCYLNHLALVDGEVVRLKSEDKVYILKKAKIVEQFLFGGDEL